MNEAKHERKLVECLLAQAKDLHRAGKLEIESPNDNTALLRVNGITIRIVRDARRGSVISLLANGAEREYFPEDVWLILPLWPEKLKRLSSYLFTHKEPTDQAQRMQKVIMGYLLDQS